MFKGMIAGAIGVVIAVTFFSPNDVRAAGAGGRGVAGARPAAPHAGGGRFSANRFRAANLRRFPHRRFRGVVAPWGWWPDCTAYGTCGYEDDQLPYERVAPARVYQPSCQLQSHTHMVRSERDGGERKVTIIGCSTAAAPSSTAVTK
jgi:hypothetical protein